MAKGGGNTTQTTKVELPKWVERASEDNYKFAQQVANKPYNPYLGQTVADVSQGTQDAYQLFYNTLGQGNDNYAKAGELFDRASGGILSLDRNAYMNPFIDEVENKSLNALDKQRRIALMQNSDKAISAGAFGGDRSAIVDAITNAESAEKAGLLSAGLRKDAFDTASGLMTGDLANWLTAAGGQIATGDAFQKQRMADVTGLLGIGQQQQQQQQMELDDLKGRFDEANDYDLERLNILLSSLGMSPYGRTETATVKGGGSAFDPAQFGLGLISTLAGLSDERAKENLIRVGEKHGVPVYEWNYIGDDTVHRGPMAQDVEKVSPESVIEVNGLKMVDKEVLGVLGYR